MNLKLLKICALLAVLVLAVGWHVKDKREGVQEAITATTSVLNAQYDKSLKEATEKALRASNSLQVNADKERDNKDAQIKTINDRLDSALGELRNRPQRPSAESLATRSVYYQACTARELYREDAEFLTREAARAETVLTERNYYYEQYEAVRKKINGTAE